MDKIASKPFPQFKKDDAFVEIAPHPLVFMEVNDAGVKLLKDKKEAKSLCREYSRKLIELLPDVEESLLHIRVIR